MTVPATVTGDVRPLALIVLQPKPVPSAQVDASDAPGTWRQRQAACVVAVSAREFDSPHKQEGWHKAKFQSAPATTSSS